MATKASSEVSGASDWVIRVVVQNQLAILRLPNNSCLLLGAHVPKYNPWICICMRAGVSASVVFELPKLL